MKPTCNTQGDLPAKTIAANAGFGKYETMRKAFQKLLGATAVPYCERFVPVEHEPSTSIEKFTRLTSWLERSANRVSSPRPGSGTVRW